MFDFDIFTNVFRLEYRCDSLIIRSLNVLGIFFEIVITLLSKYQQKIICLKWTYIIFGRDLEKLQVSTSTST